MNPPDRAYIQVHQIEHKALITAEIPEMPPNAKPCYYPGAGYTHGAFLRVADGDRKLSAYEVQMMLSARGQPTDDEEPVPGTTVADLQARSVKGLLSRLRKRPGSVFSRMPDEAILRTLKVLVPAGRKWVCLLGGMLALGKYPQRFLPALGLTFVVYPTSDVGEPGPSQERFLDNVRIEGTIPDMLRPTLDVLRRNMKRRSVVKAVSRGYRRVSRNGGPGSHHQCARGCATQEWRSVRIAGKAAESERTWYFRQGWQLRKMVGRR